MLHFIQKLPRLVISISYDQTQDELQSITHFQILIYNFFDGKDNFNKVTLKQLQDAPFSVYNREKNTALTEIFSIELKFTVDCLKFWFSKNHEVLELDVDYKQEFKDNNVLTAETLSCICSFPINSRAKNGWADHAFKAE